MRTGWRGVIWSAVLGALSTPSSAAPSASVDMLMNTPTPLLSFGLVRLQDALRGRFGTTAEAADGITGYAINVVYDADRDRIVLRFSDFSFLTEGGEESCAPAFKAIRNYGGVTETGGYAGTATSSFYARLFMPIGIDAPELTGVAAALDAVMEIDLMAGMFPMTTCRGPLLGDGHTVEISGFTLSPPPPGQVPDMPADEGDAAR